MYKEKKKLVKDFVHSFKYSGIKQCDIFNSDVSYEYSDSTWSILIHFYIASTSPPMLNDVSVVLDIQIGH